MKRSILAVLFMAASAATFAQTRTPAIRQHQQNQQHRIRQGVNSGTLTPREAGHLETREAKIQQDKRRAKADGQVSAGERAKLQREQNHASAAIYRQKHDAQTAR